MKKYYKYLIFVTLGLFLTFGAIVYIFSNMILFPAWYKPGLPTDCGKTIMAHNPELCEAEIEKNFKVTFEPLELDSSVGKVRGWYFPHPKESSKLVIFVHGAGADRREGYSRLSFLQENGYSYIVYDSPNHGKSENNGKGVNYGFREKEGFKAVFDFARQKSQSIFVITNSFGIGAVALSLDYWRGGINGLVLENPPYSLESLVKGNPIAASLPVWLVDFVLAFTEFRSGIVISEIKPGEIARKFPEIPVFVLHGTLDGTVPFSQGENFYRNIASSKKEFFRAENAGHGQVFYDYPEDYKKLVLRNFSEGQK